MNENTNGIGGKIKTARKAAKMSQTVLAEHLGKTLRTVQKYESNEIEPSISVIYEIARILDTSPAELMGYQKKDLHLDSFSDILLVLFELNRKAGLRFEIDVKRPPRTEEWSCSIRFNGNEPSAQHNADLCLFLERFSEERERLETYWIDQDYFDYWFEQELAYYTNIKLENKQTEILTIEERLLKRNALDQKMMNERKKKDISSKDDLTNVD